MQFPTADDEDADFLAAGSSRSRLSSLFQSEKSSGGDVNQALTFTAPKQPKKDNPQGTPGTMKLIHAVVVHTYKLSDGNFVNQGKLGCAVLGHHESHTYKLLLYKGKQIQVTVASLTPNFIFHVQPNNYANFYDEKKENWSINFDSETVLFEFAKQVTLAKANAQGKTPDSLVIQDLAKGEGQSLENGDTAEVKYKGWLLTNYTFGQVFDTNMNSESLYRVHLGKGKVIKGWNDGLVGMQKGGKRLLIIPPDLAYGSEGVDNVVPPNSTLIFEVHVVKVKFGRESSHSPSPVKASESTAEKKPQVPARQSFSQEDNIRMRGTSISEQLTQSPKKDKAQLISRMAKMGTATLPFQGAIPAQVSTDSESEVEPPQPSSPAHQNVSRTSSPKTPSKMRSRNDSGSSVLSQTQTIQASVPFQAAPSSSQMSLYAQSAMPSQQPFVCAATPFPTFQQQMPGQFSIPQSPYSTPSVPGFMPPVSTSIADSHFSYLVSETRNQNTEVRMSLSKITDKVDTVIQKVDDIRLQGRNTNNNTPYMESTIILQNIERIIQENTQLKEDNNAKVSKIQSLNEIICDLIQRNPRFTVENNSASGQKNELLQAAANQSQEEISNLEQEKHNLQSELSTMSGKLNKLENDLSKYQKLENELNEKLEAVQNDAETQTKLLKEAKEKMNDDKTVISSLQEKLKSLEHERELLNMKLQSIEEKHTQSAGSSELIEVYKKEIQEYKEKVDELNGVINDSVPVAQVKEEKERIEAEINEIRKNKDQMEKELQKKIDSYEELKLSYEGKIRQLESEVENSKTLKKKYEVFQEKTRALKETYEKQIMELMNKVKHLQSTKSEVSSEFSVEIKKVMNRLYKLLQGKFQPDTSYSGSEVLEVVLKTIMGLTFQLLESSNQPVGDQSNNVEPSDKAFLNKQNISEGSEIKESVEENGLDEPVSKTEVVAEKSLNHPENVPENPENVTRETGYVSEQTMKPVVEEISENVPEIPESTCEKPGSASEQTITPVVEEISESAENSEAPVQKESSVPVNEPVKRESPEIWRQPPPLFDDDDDDEEDDDDWLK